MGADLQAVSQSRGGGRVTTGHYLAHFSGKMQWRAACKLVSVQSKARHPKCMCACVCMLGNLNQGCTMSSPFFAVAITHRHTQTQTHRHTDTDTDTQTQTHRHRHRHTLLACCPSPPSLHTGLWAAKPRTAAPSPCRCGSNPLHRAHLQATLHRTRVPHGRRHPRRRRRRRSLTACRQAQASVCSRAACTTSMTSTTNTTNTTNTDCMRLAANPCRRLRFATSQIEWRAMTALCCLMWQRQHRHSKNSSRKKNSSRRSRKSWRRNSNMKSRGRRRAAATLAIARAAAAASPHLLHPTSGPVFVFSLRWRLSRSLKPGWQSVPGPTTSVRLLLALLVF